MSARDIASTQPRDRATPSQPVHARLIPMIVAVPMFLQAIDTSILGTALQSIAVSLNADVLRLNFAVTAYLLSLAIFLPASGWLTDRFGTRRVFCAAVAIFSVASALCGAATSITEIVLFRVLQGLGGAMMVPVGRLILLRSVPAAQLVAAMVWFTIPGTVGRVVGPLVGGAIVTLGSWRWMFLLNIPFGVLGILLSLKFVPDSRSDHTEPFDVAGFALVAVGLSGIVCGLETLGHPFVPLGVTVGLVATGAVATVAYGWYGRGRVEAIIPLRILRYNAFRITSLGGMPLRMAVGSAPIFVPLFLQVGLGFTALQSGLMSAWLSLGAFGVRPILKRSIARFGFRSVMMLGAGCTAVAFASIGLFRSNTPVYWICIVLFVSGIAHSLGMVTMNTVGFSGIDKRLMSKATALSTMFQQTSMSFGVALCSLCVTVSARINGHGAGQLTADDFPMTFYVTGALTTISLVAFFALPKHEGRELS